MIHDHGCVDMTVYNCLIFNHLFDYSLYIGAGTTSASVSSVSFWLLRSPGNARQMSINGLYTCPIFILVMFYHDRYRYMSAVSSVSRIAISRMHHLFTPKCCDDKTVALKTEKTEFTIMGYNLFRSWTGLYEATQRRRTFAWFIVISIRSRCDCGVKKNLCGLPILL